MAALEKEFNTGTRHRVNPQWRKLTRAGQIKLVHELNISSRMHADPTYKRLKYVRYADDFLIGIVGDKVDCIAIREIIHTFLLKELKLNLNLEKTKITHARNEMAHFLGTDIRITPLDKRPTSLVIRGNGSYMARSATRPQLLAPIPIIVDRLIAKGLAKPGGAPTRWTKQIHFEVSQIINTYKSMWVGLKNYYSFADNYSSLWRIFYIFKYSCVLTLASKLKLGTAKAVFRKFGKDLAVVKDDKVVTSFKDESLAKIKKPKAWGTPS